MKTTPLVKSISVLICFIVFCSSCKENSEFDPYFGFELGCTEAQWKSNLAKLMEDSTWVQIGDDSGFCKGSVVVGASILNFEVDVNEDDYHFDNLRYVSFDLSASLGRLFTDIPPPRSTIIDSLYQMYVAELGEPDSVDFVFNDLEYRKHGLWRAIVYSTKEDSLEAIELGKIEVTLYKHAYAVWRKDDHKVEFIRDRCKLNMHRETTYESAVLWMTWEHSKRQRGEIRDSIKKQLEPDDLVRFVPYRPSWESTDYTNYNLKIGMYQIRRDGREEQRYATAVRFDIHLVDLFGDTLFSFNGNDYYFPDGQGGITEDGEGLTAIDPIEYNVEYNKFSPTAEGIEKAREHPDNVNILFDVVSIVFEDGSIFK